MQVSTTVLAERGLDWPKKQPVDPRAKNCLQALAMFCSAAALAERDLCQISPKHLDSGMIGTVEFMRLTAEVCWESFLENSTTYLCLGLIEGEAIFGGNIGNHFTLVFGTLSGRGNSSYIICISSSSKIQVAN